MRRLVALLVAAALTTVPLVASGSAWTSYLKVEDFTDVLALPDQVWGATAEAGLVRLDRATGRVDAIRREPGVLGSNRLSRLAVDPSGRVWVGTRGAGVSLLRPSGLGAGTLRVLAGLPGDTVSVLEAQGDTMWIGTTQGLALWDGREIIGSLPDANTISFDTTFVSLSLTGVEPLGDTLWLATRRGIGFARLSTQLTDWRPVNQGLTSLEVASLASDGTSLFARAGGVVHRFRPELGLWEPDAGPGTVRGLVDDQGVVLAVGAGGLYRWSGSDWVAIAGAPVAGASADDPEPAVDPSGVAFAARGDGIFEQPASGPWIAHPVPAGPPGNDLLQVALEGTRVYVTTPESGVARFDGSAWRVWPPGACAGAGCDTTFENPYAALGLLVDAQGHKWVGCWSFALDELDDSQSPPSVTHHVVATNQALEKRTWALSSTLDAEGGRWFGMDTPAKGDIDPIGLEYYDASGGYVGNFNPANTNMAGSFARALTTSRNGRIWVGYDDGKGLDFFTLPANGDFVHLPSTDNLSIRGLAAYGDSVWALTGQELLRFSQSAGTASQPAVRFAMPGTQPQFGVRPLAVAADGTVWAGSVSGLSAFHPGGRTESFTTRNSPISDDEVRAIAIDPASGVVWITTAAGLDRYDPSYVAPRPPELGTLHVQVYPNPLRLTGLGAPLRITADAPLVQGEVLDIAGRRVRRFGASASGQVIWDGRGDDGSIVSPGVYLIRTTAGRRHTITRVVLLR